jgi:hypothetical protein
VTVYLGRASSGFRSLGEKVFKYMQNTLTVQEVAIAVAAKDFNPTVVNPDFLKYSDIIPGDWELARPPVYTNRLAQLMFNNGIGIVAQPNQLVLVETIGPKKIEDVQVAEMACRCVQTLSKIDYQAVGVNSTGFVICESEAEAHQYLCQNLLAPGAWQEFGEARLNAGIQLSYSLKRGQLNLGINQATLKDLERNIPAVLFSSNFNYPIVGATQSERLADLQQVIRNWQGDITTYRQLVHEKFLLSAGETSDFELEMVSS